MMNDPFVVEQSKLWGKRMLAAGPDDAAACVPPMLYVQSRTSDAEQATASAFLTAKPKPTAKPSPAKKPGLISATRC